MASKNKSKADRRTTMVRIVSLTLVALMLLSVVSAAVFSQVW